jgi:hypothetical protein
LPRAESIALVSSASIPPITVLPPPPHLSVFVLVPVKQVK